MHTTINHNGAIIAGETAGISPVNAGLLHGWGVFTTLRIYDGQPFLFDEHWNRLEQHASVIGLDRIWNQSAVRDWLMELIKVNNVAEGKSRITLLQAESRFWRLGTPA